MYEANLGANSQIRVLHVLTLSGSAGEYGGPTSVAHQLCLELHNRGYIAQIFSGTLVNSAPSEQQGFLTTYEPVRPLLRSFPISSLFSIKVPFKLQKLIRQQDIVHIHFGRDITSILAAFICNIFRKPYFTQTHGMIIHDSRFITKLFDFYFTKPLLKRSEAIFVLTEIEMTEIKSLAPKALTTYLKNGIKVSKIQSERTPNVIPVVTFCSRLNYRKRPDRFLKIAKRANAEGVQAHFQIYGPDSGELDNILNELQNDLSLSGVEYKGAVSHEEVQNVLKYSDLLILPSENEPFPMIVLESLSLGTPVLIMPSCGIANTLRLEFPYLVSLSESDEDIYRAFSNILNRSRQKELRESYAQFAKNTFDIGKILDDLESWYLRVKHKNEK